MSKAENLPRKSDISNFIIEYTSQDKLARLIGITFVIILSISIIYIGTWQAAYAKQFYKVKFKINFLEGVQPGMKIRYQGGVIIGEVINIESDYHNHYLNAIIKKDFKIIKYGTEISLKEQGTFGGSYIDISTIPYYFESATYSPNEIINIKKIVPFQETLTQFLNLFQESDQSESVIVLKLKQIKSMVNKISNNKGLIPPNMNNSLKNIYSGISSGLGNANKLALDLYNIVDNVNTKMSKVAESLRKNLPIFRRTTQKIYNFSNYNPGEVSEKQFLHDEQFYYSFLIKLQIINDIMEKYKNHPYKLIFESGL